MQDILTYLQETHCLVVCGGIVFGEGEGGNKAFERQVMFVYIEECQFGRAS